MNAANSNGPAAGGPERTDRDYVTVRVGQQLFGLPIERVRDVFKVQAITAVPHAPAEISGLLNLRGRVVTAICLRGRLGLGDPGTVKPEIAVGIEYGGEAYGLLVDSVGEVMTLAGDSFEPNPVHMDQRWAGLARGVHRLDGKLLVILDVDAIPRSRPPSIPAALKDPNPEQTR